MSPCLGRLLKKDLKISQNETTVSTRERKGKWVLSRSLKLIHFLMGLLERAKTFSFIAAEENVIVAVLELEPATHLYR
jgi:hypothetical protein